MYGSIIFPVYLYGACTTVALYEGNDAKGLLQALEDRFLNVEKNTVQAEVQNSIPCALPPIRLERNLSTPSKLKPKFWKILVGKSQRAITRLKEGLTDKRYSQLAHSLHAAHDMTYVSSLIKGYENTPFGCYIHSHMLTHCSNAFLFMSQVHMRAFSPNRPCQHNTRLVYLDVHRYDAEGTIMEEIPAGGCSYVYLVGDFSFGRLPEDEQLLVVPFVMRTLRMAGLGECPFGPLHP